VSLTPGEHLISQHGFGHHVDADESAIPIELQDLENSPGLMHWAPSDDGLIPVDVMSDAHRARAVQRNEGG
jgi:hypothetical protein